MTAPKHTPGPWYLAATNGGFQIRNRLSGKKFPETAGLLVATVPHFEVGHNADRANARLIAAAPELLEVLEEALGHLEILKNYAEVTARHDPDGDLNIDWDNVSSVRIHDLLARLTTTLQKARGEA